MVTKYTYVHVPNLLDFCTTIHLLIYHPHKYVLQHSVVLVQVFHFSFSLVLV